VSKAGSVNDARECRNPRADARISLKSYPLPIVYTVAPPFFVCVIITEIL